MTQEERLQRAREWHDRHVTERAELETRVNLLLADKALLSSEVSAATERMRTIANLFSNTVWGLLPEKIKEYFEEYRTR